jgi:peptide/nickel transport system ATP-binding protein
MALVEVNAVGKSYPRQAGFRTEQHAVVEDVSLSIESGETLGLVGESGSGKTTLARMILGLIAPTEGSIRVDGIDVARASSAELHRLRRQMQPVFQDPYAALNPRMKVLEIVTEPWIIHKLDGSSGGAKAPDILLALSARLKPCPFKTRLSTQTDLPTLKSRAVELLKEVGLDESALDRYPHEFSGGQRQRINIARALALKPRLLILDEPVSALDVSVGAQIVNLLRRLQSEHGLTYLFISHSMPLVRYLCTRIAVMQQGRLVETGEAEDLCSHPQEAYTRQLIQATPELPHRVA